FEPYSVMSLRGKTMGIIGFGNIGRRTARVAKAFDMWVIGTRRSVTKPGKARWADLMLPIANLDRLLAESDYVVVTAPHTPETHHLIGPRQFHAMKKSAFLVNVGRGPVVDESALAAALQQGRIAGAALDVFEEEPLPQDSPLWGLPNLIYSPHVAGHIVEYPGLVRELFVRNLEHYVKGERLSGIVDKEHGY
ncbi:MAG: D-2-hydroxyacid dehydrogenase, partial [Chloroflexi bacterium]|nr:D-2-hydroxyacid dehydrogenase [Chloroflexota bacterium]